nr:hypothetical protein [Tanacetum cinerariifolium]
NSLNDSLSISETSSQSPPNIDHCRYECGDALDGIFCQQCICKSCGKGAHISYNCPPKVLIIPNPKPCNNQTIDELPQALPIFHPTFHSEAESPCTLDSTPTYVDESPNVFNPPPQHPMYPCEFCGNDAYFGHYCTPQAQFNNPEQGYSQDVNFPQYIHNFQQQYFCCDQCEAPHETFQSFYFDDDHIKEISSGSTTTHSDISLSEYDSFIFEEFVDELAHIISLPEYECFYFWDLPDSGELMSVLNFGIRENLSTTRVNLPIEDDHSPLLTYVVWIFVAYLTYPVIPPYLHPFGNEDTIFDPGITINHFYFKAWFISSAWSFQEIQYSPQSLK